MYYILILVAFMSIIYCFPSPKGFLVDEEIIDVFNKGVSDIKLDDFENNADKFMEKFLDDSFDCNYMTANMENETQNKTTDIDDVKVSDILDAGNGK